MLRGNDAAGAGGLESASIALDIGLDSLRRLQTSSQYHYETSHGFFFFLSTLFFVAFWIALYRYYSGHSATSPSDGRGGQLTSRYSWRPAFAFQSAQPANGTVVSGKGAGSHTQSLAFPSTISLPSSKMSYNPSVSVANPAYNPPMAFVVDEYGRTSVIPSAIAVQISPSRQ